MIKETTALFYVTCDTDDCDQADFDDYVPYFESREQALVTVVNHYGFCQLADGTLLCRTHNTERLCAENGHDWDDWQGCYCNGAFDEHADQCRQQRWCQRCQALDPSGAPCPQQERPHLLAPYAVGDQTDQLVELWNWTDAQAIAGLRGITLYRHTDNGWQAIVNEGEPCET